MKDKKTEALKLALEALVNPWKAGPHGVANAITAIREALAEQPAQQDIPKIGCVNHDCDKCKAQQHEPLAWMDADGDFYKDEPKENWCPPHTQLYTSPQPSKPWVGLDDADLDVCDTDGRLLARYWERVLREKNT